ncbi:hypothetical protein DL93DRAFT_414053 [Clavulina sp. PMI_390]|nr:hypothetical protein DL93DRAFT_414053 [Clavulina sp. PMI_390]
MSAAPKKLKASNGKPIPAPTEDVKGKGKAVTETSDAMAVDSASEEDENSSDDGADSGDDDADASDDSMDTEDEIELAQQHASKSKQTLKRKRRAIPNASFGQALSALLDTSTAPKSSPNVDATPSTDATAPSTSAAADTALLALKKTTAAQRRRAAEKREAKAAKSQLGERREREEKNRITDVIGGWGGESERALRKVAQRGVVKLFNVIQQAQQSNIQALAPNPSTRGTGKASLPAPKADEFRSDKRKGKGEKDNAIGRAKPAALNQEDFLQSIRAGGIVSKV